MTAGLKGGGGTSAEDDDAQDSAGALSGGGAGAGRSAAGVLADRMAAALVHREPGWKLPRRSALARRFSVSLAEIDVAVEELSRRSLLRKLPDGQLYRASPAEYQIPIEGLAGLSTTLDPMGSSISCQAKHISRRQAPQDICWALGLDPGTQVRVIRCLWTSAGSPVAMSTAYVPQAPGARPPDGQQLSAPRLKPDESNGVPAFDEVLSEPPADEGGPEAGISSEETRGAIQPMSSTGTGISSGSEARLAYPHLAWPPTSVIVMWPIVVSALAPCQWRSPALM